MHRLWRWLWHAAEQPVSVQWRKDQFRTEGQQGTENVSIRFPIRKLTNESSLFNRAKLRKKA